jgi:hypothetical protein
VIRARHSPLWLALVTALWAGPAAGFALFHMHAAPSPGVLAVMAGAGLAAGSVLVHTPRPLLRLRGFERNGRLWERFGVRAFATIAPYGRGLGGRAGDRPLGRSGLPDAVVEAEANERLHYAMLLAGGSVAVWAASLGAAPVALYLALAAVPLNLYPIALQRHLRGRLQCAIRRADARAAKRQQPIP